MNPITDLWRQLVRRRLWPVALLLRRRDRRRAGAPRQGARRPSSRRDPAASAPPRRPASLATEPIVSARRRPTATRGRKPLGKQARHLQADARSPKVAEGQTKADRRSRRRRPTVKPPTRIRPAARAPGRRHARPRTTPTEPRRRRRSRRPTRCTRCSCASARRRQSAKSHAASVAARCRPTRTPLIIYLGLTDRPTRPRCSCSTRRVKAQGDGECHPTPESCETLHLQAGETEFFDIVDADGATTGRAASSST